MHLLPQTPDLQLHMEQFLLKNSKGWLNNNYTHLANEKKTTLKGIGEVWTGSHRKPHQQPRASPQE